MNGKRRKNQFYRNTIILAAFFFTFLAIPCFAAEDPAKFPSKPINLIIQWAAGGTTDLTGRKLAELAGKILGQPIVVENKTGGAGVIAATALKNAAPDGYTLGTATWSSMVYVPHLRSVPYNVKKDYVWLMQYAEAPQLFGVLINARWKTFKDFIEEARKNPGKLTYSSVGPLSGSHIFMEQIAQIEKVKITHVPTSGGAEAVSKLLGGHIDAGIVNELCVHVESGKIRPLAFQSEKKFELMPNVPTFWDLGYQIETPIWFGLHTPAGVPPLVVKKLHDAFKKAYDDPSFKKLLLTLHMMPYYRNTESFTARVIADYDTQGRILNEFGFLKKEK
jgi:tripartite-type tricarboxylate transporter receptor subunit TctC